MSRNRFPMVDIWEIIQRGTIQDGGQDGRHKYLDQKIEPLGDVFAL